MEDFAAVKNNDELQQSPEKPEISIAGNGQVQDAVRPDKLNLLVQVAEDVETESLGRIGGRHARNFEARCQDKKRKCAEDPGSHRFRVMRKVGEGVGYECMG